MTRPQFNKEDNFNDICASIQKEIAAGKKGERYEYIIKDIEFENISIPAKELDKGHISTLQEDYLSGS